MVSPWTRRRRYGRGRASVLTISVCMCRPRRGDGPRQCAQPARHVQQGRGRRGVRSHEEGYDAQVPAPHNLSWYTPVARDRYAVMAADKPYAVASCCVDTTPKDAPKGSSEFAENPVLKRLRERREAEKRAEEEAQQAIKSGTSAKTMVDQAAEDQKSREAEDRRIGESLC